MKKGRYRWSALLLVLLVTLGFLTFPDEASADSTEPFRVGMEVNYAPFNWSQTSDANGAVPVANSSGEFANGYDVWMAQKMAEALDRPLEIHKIEWDGLAPALTSGKIDAIIAGMSPTPERKKEIDFTEIYYTSNLVLVVQKDGAYANAKSLADFAGAKITAQLNTFHYDVIDQIPGVAKQTALDSFPTMITALKAGSIDGYVSERPGALAAIMADPHLAMVEFAEGQGFQADPENTTVAIGIQKSSPLMASLNEALQAISEEERQQVMDQMVALQAEPSESEGEEAVSEEAAESTSTSEEDTDAVASSEANSTSGEDSFLNDVGSIWGEYQGLFFRGTLVTLFLSFFGTAIGLLIGFVVQIIRSIPTAKKAGVSKWGIRLGQMLCTAYVEVFRSTPMIVQAMLIYYGSKQFFGIDMNPLVAALLIVSINTGAYLAETIRGGIDSVDRGQFEAAHALGLTHHQQMVSIILPQAMRAILPSIGNEFIVNIKDTSVLNVISVTELFFLTKSIAGSTFKIFPAYFIVAVIYFILTRLANFLIRILAKHFTPNSNFTIQSTTEA